MIRLLVLPLFLIGVAAVPTHAQVSASARMAYFSPSQVFTESSVGKTLHSRVTAVETERAKAVQERSSQLERIARTLQQGTAVLSDAARGQRTKELEKFRLDTQRFIEDAQAEMMGVRRDAESAFLVKLRPAIERVIKDNAIQLLFNFDSGVLAWGDPGLDVTKQVIARVDEDTAPPK